MSGQWGGTQGNRSSRSSRSSKQKDLLDCLLACRYITEEEMEPVMDVLMPGERHYAKEQAEHMITQADGNGDGMLELHEMETHPYVFYNVAYDKEEEQEEESYHDEFRR